MVRLSILEVTWKEMRVGKFALIVPVMTSTEGRWVAMMRWMPEARAIWARRWMQASISLPATIIRSAISSTMTTMKGIERGVELLGLEHRLAGVVVEAGLDGAGEGLAALERVLDALVVAVDVAHAHLRHLAVAVLHLGDHPFQATTAFLGSVTTGESRWGMPS
jgi:hypothetical protein